MQDFLFDTPYWLLGLLVVGTAVIWISGNSRQNDAIKRLALIPFLLAIALGLLSFLIDTDKEKVIKRTRQIVTAVEKQDKAAADQLLHPQADLAGFDKTAILARIGTAASQYHIGSIRITSIDVQPSGPDLSVVFSATANLEMGSFSGPVPSTWTFTWEKTGQGWLLRDIRPINLHGIDLQSVIGNMKGE
jgi:hypothetical protein